LSGKSTDAVREQNATTPSPQFFDIHERSAKLTEIGDPLTGLNEQIGWEAFRRSVNRVYVKVLKSKAGAKPIDVVLMFKILVLQQLHNLSDDRCRMIALSVRYEIGCHSCGFWDPNWRARCGR